MPFFTTEKPSSTEEAETKNKQRECYAVVLAFLVFSVDLCASVVNLTSLVHPQGKL